MKIQYMAHSAFLLTAENGTKILMDPYESGGYNGAINYKPINEIVDVIVISHSHADHSYVDECHKNAVIFDKPGLYEYKDVKIEGIKTFHDKTSGSERGENVIFIITIDGMRICHLGDLGHLLDETILQHLENMSVLFLPVGGIFTLDFDQATQLMDALHPKICIPMHYKTEKIKVDLAMVDDFLAEKKNVKHFQKSEIEIVKNKLPKETQVWVLKPEKL